MRRRPTVNPHGIALPQSPQQPPGPLPPAWHGDVLEPFLVSGGAGFFIVTDSPPISFDARPSGVQLCCSVYVPTGKVGFLKQLRVAPFMPTQLVDPWHTSGIGNTVNSWREFDADGAGPVRAGGQNGVWETPFGWESYFDSATCGEQPPQWTWQLRLVKGDVARARSAFDLTDPNTWYLVPDIAVPRSPAYSGGIPGAAPSGFWGPQRMQVLQGDELDTHVIVPEDTTLCLFTQWTQLEFQPLSNDGETVTEYGPPVFPLLPSFGQLHGYMQSAQAESAILNAKYGWGG